MLVNMAKGSLVHKRSMFAALIRLLTIASIMLVPLGMLSTPAIAAEHKSAAASMPCDGHERPSKAASDSRAHCTSCVAIAEPQSFLPEATFRLAPDLTDRADPLLLGCAHDVATPPPKAA